MILRNGENAEITILNSEKNSNLSSQKKGIISQRQETEYQARRKKNGNGITFFDLGFINTVDGFREIPFNSRIEYTLDVDGFPVFELNPNDKFQDLYDYLFSFDVETLKNNFYQIKKIDVPIYGLSLITSTTATDSSQWQGNALVIEQSKLEEIKLEIVSPSIIYATVEDVRIRHESGSNVKITTLPDADSDAVIFTASNTMQVFFVPILIDAISTFGKTSPLRSYQFLSSHKVASRRNYLEETFEYYHKAFFNGGVFDYSLDYLKSYFENAYVSYIEDGVGFSEETPSFVPPSEPYTLDSASMQGFYKDDTLQTLAMIIKSNGQWFYFWI